MPPSPTGSGFNAGTVYATLVLRKDQFTYGLRAAAKEANANARLIEREFGRVRNGIERVNNAMILMGTVGTAGLVLATKKAAEFEQAMRNVNTVSRLGEQALRGLSEEVKELSRSMPNDAIDLAQGLYQIGSSGFHGAEGMKVLNSSAIAASAGLTTTVNAAEAIVGVLNAYGKSADEASAVSDTLFLTVDKGIITFEQLTQSIGDVIATAAAAKVPFEDVGAAMATITKGGIRPYEAVTALNRLLMEFLQPGKEFAKVIKAWGYESGLTLLQEKGLYGAMQLLQKHTGGSADAISKLLPEMRAFRGAVSLSRNGVKDFGKDIALFHDPVERSGAAVKAFNEQAKGTAFQAKIARSQLIAAAIDIGNQLLPVARDLIVMFKELVDWLRKVPASTLAAGAAFLILWGVLGKTAILAVQVAEVLKAVRTALFATAVAAPSTIAKTNETTMAFRQLITWVKLAPGWLKLAAAAILVVAGAFVYLKTRQDAAIDKAKTELEMLQKTKKAREDYAQTLGFMADRLDALKDKTGKGEMQEVAQIQEQLKSILPEVAKYIGEQATKWDGNAKALRKMATTLRDYAKLERETSLARLRLQIAEATLEQRKARREYDIFHQTRYKKLQAAATKASGQLPPSSEKFNPWSFGGNPGVLQRSALHAAAAAKASHGSVVNPDAFNRLVQNTKMRLMGKGATAAEQGRYIDAELSYSTANLTMLQQQLALLQRYPNGLSSPTQDDDKPKKKTPDEDKKKKKTPKELFEERYGELDDLRKGAQAWVDNLKAQGKYRTNKKGEPIGEAAKANAALFSTTEELRNYAIDTFSKYGLRGGSGAGAAAMSRLFDLNKERTDAAQKAREEAAKKRAFHREEGLSGIPPGTEAELAKRRQIAAETEKDYRSQYALLQAGKGSIDDVSQSLQEWQQALEEVRKVQDKLHDNEVKARKQRIDDLKRRVDAWSNSPSMIVDAKGNVVSIPEGDAKPLAPEAAIAQLQVMQRANGVKPDEYLAMQEVIDGFREEMAKTSKQVVEFGDQAEESRIEALRDAGKWTFTDDIARWSKIRDVNKRLQGQHTPNSPAWMFYGSEAAKAEEKRADAEKKRKAAEEKQDKKEAKTWEEIRDDAAESLKADYEAKREYLEMLREHIEPLKERADLPEHLLQGLENAGIINPGEHISGKDALDRVNGRLLALLEDLIWWFKSMGMPDKSISRLSGQYDRERFSQLAKEQPKDLAAEWKPLGEAIWNFQRDRTSVRDYVNKVAEEFSKKKFMDWWKKSTGNGGEINGAIQWFAGQHGGTAGAIGSMVRLSQKPWAQKAGGAALSAMNFYNSIQGIGEGMSRDAAAMQGGMSGAMSGVQMGAMAGPWGAVAGLVIGGVAGAILGSNEAERKASEAAQRIREAQLQELRKINNALSPVTDYFRSMMFNLLPSTMTNGWGANAGLAWTSAQSRGVRY